MSSRAEDQVFRALADPTRRALVGLLGRDEQSVSALTRRFRVSQPAISQHLKVLREAGLVHERREGRHRLYRLDPDPLLLAAGWLDEHTGFWTERLDDLGRHLRKKHGKNAQV
ncbi:MAG TPA: metalloregulator ArsR/SmtB family transcription factor [Allosphingosinicella sp.]|jgi:DNA-binding transcriptional ArsR family regulator